MAQFILSLDQGTTSSRAIIFDQGGNIISLAQQEFAQIYPQAGWVEHNPIEIWQSQVAVAKNALINAHIGASAIHAIGITNQRETTVVWDRRNGEPIYNAIVWQDRRTSGYCNELKQHRFGKKIQEKTGLIIDSYFSATKIRWILENVDGARDKAEAGHLAFGTIDSWLLWNLSGGKVHATDVSNASRTMLYNIHQLCWDDELLALFDIPESMLPEVKSSSEIYSHTADSIFGDKIPIAGIAGDQQSALFGQQCTNPGMVKNTYGTGCFMLMNTGTEAKSSKNNLLTTIAWQIGNQTTYALEGSIFIAGAIVQWLRDELGIIQKSSDIEALSNQVTNSNGVFIVPAFAGLGAPYWNQDARGTITGLTRGSNKAHIARAAIESIAYQTMDVLSAMQADSETPITQLRVDGGATHNNMLLQFQADVLQCNVIRPKTTEVTALGAAYLAGLATGYWKDLSSIQTQWQIDQVFEANHNNPNVDKTGWANAVRAAIANVNDQNV
jgi:glycerol kinase